MIPDWTQQEPAWQDHAEKKAQEQQKEDRRKRIYQLRQELSRLRAQVKVTTVESIRLGSLQKIEDIENELRSLWETV
jgi:ribosomal protein L29